MGVVMKTITTRGLSFGSVIKFLYIGFAIPLFLIGLGLGIAAYMGSEVVMLNDTYVYGLKGLLTGIIGFGILLPLILSLVYGIILFIGQFLWTRFSSFDLMFKE